MDPNSQWGHPLPPMRPPLPPPATARRAWLPAAIIGAAIVIAAGLIAGAVILKKDHAAEAPGTCDAWTETRLTLRSIPPLPDGWTWKTPGISTLIKNQNAPVAKTLDLFEPKIAAEPADIAQAAQQYVAARRKQIDALSDRTYTPEVGVAVDAALKRLNELCGIPADGRPV